jgi:predicted GNAT family acetyltransferase
MQARVVDDADARRYELYGNDVLVGWLTYADQGADRVFLHTEVDPAFEGQGYASVLVAEAVADVRAEGRQVIASCPYVQHWFARHPDQRDVLVA